MYYIPILFNNEYKEGGAPFMAPKARSGGGPIVPHSVGASFEEFFGEHTSLG